jgi:hypothetical protein
MPRTTASILRLVTATAIGMTVVACSATAGGSPSAGTPSAAASAPLRPAPSVEPRPTVVATASPVTGEVPAAVMDAVNAQLATDTGTDPATATVVKAEAVEWPDGSLGCPQRGVMYVQVVTPGYQVVLRQNGRDYDYRVAGEGQSIRLCEGLQPAAS